MSPDEAKAGPATPRSPRTPNPRPLAILVLSMSFLGGSCSIHALLRAESKVPDRVVLEAALKERSALLPGASLPPEMVDVLEALLVESEVAMRRLRPYEVGFGFLLFFAYSLAMVAALRAARFEPGSAAQVSLLCLLVPPARAAVAAVELAFDQRFARSLAKAFSALKPPLDRPAPENFGEVARLVGEVSGLVIISFHAAIALVVCLVFTYAWRYFQRPEVLALYARNDRPGR